MRQVQEQTGPLVYEQEITVASTTWVITHNLGSHPAIEQQIHLLGVVTKAFPLTVTHTSVNAFTITWSTPYTGFVRAVAQVI